MPAREYMVSPVHTVRDSDKLALADRKMRELGVSGLPVIDQAGVPVGVISRTDLLRAGRVRMLESPRRRVLNLPDARVAEYRTAGVEVVSPDTPMHEAARRLVAHRIHRIYVVEDRRLPGVLSTREMMSVLVETRTPIPLARIMSESVVSVKTDDPLSLAVDRLAATHVTGLVVVEDGWPVGIFSQEEALASRIAPPDRPVEEWMDTTLLVLPEGLPVHRAAAQALATRARRVLAVDGQEVRGVVSGTDFARVVAQRGNP